MTILIRNLAQIATPIGSQPLRGAGLRALRVIEDAAIAIRGDRIAYVGVESDLPDDLRTRPDREIDARRGTAIPGFVDSHTHLPWAGLRESEFNRRLSGESYESIAASGGGIASTVRTTREASESEIVDQMLVRTRTMTAHGTTTAEAKSGYGLTLEDELKQLRAIRSASERSSVRLVPTCCAAHEFPPEMDRTGPERRDWIDQVNGEIMPAVVREGLASYCDVFVERGVFTRAEGEEIMRRGIDLGMTPRIHVDELSDQDGAALAVDLGAASADHLMHVSDRGIERLAASNTVANLLPGTSFFLMVDQYAPARRLIDKGAIVSLSTDCNPGSSNTESMQMIIQLATLEMRMTVEESLVAATLNGACSLGLGAETGSLEVGKSADIVVLDAPSYLHLVYHFGINLVSNVVARGEVVAG